MPGSSTHPAAQAGHHLPLPRARDQLARHERRRRTHASPPSRPATPFALPDNRAWEMVSPPDKHGAPVEALTREGGLILASEDGDALTYVADGAIGEEAQGNRSPELQQVLATRGARRLELAGHRDAQQQGAGRLGRRRRPSTSSSRPTCRSRWWNPWGTSAVLRTAARARSQAEDDVPARRRSPAHTCRSSPKRTSPPGTEFGGRDPFRRRHARPQPCRAALRSRADAGPPSAPGLYEWSAGALQFVSVLPGRDARAAKRNSGTSTSRARARDLERRLADHLDDQKTNTRRGPPVHARHRDGRNGPARRRAGRRRTERTGSAQFQTASSDGSRVFFTDKQRLTRTRRPNRRSRASPTCTSAKWSKKRGKLACNLKDLTVDHNEGEHAAVQGFLLGASEDGTSVVSRRPGRARRQRKRQRRKARRRARTTCTSCITTARTGRRRSSRCCRAKTARSGKATGIADTAYPDRARLARRALSGVHVRREPDRL